MNFLKELGAGITSTASKALFKMKKNSPELLIASGVILVVTGTVIACRRTEKAKEILEARKEELKTIEEVRNDPQFDQVYSDQDYRMDKDSLTVRTAVKLTLTYLPAVLVEGAGIACILGAYGILKKRAAILMAAYEAVSTAYLNYRNRVHEEFGEETEEAIYHGKPIRKFSEPPTEAEQQEETDIADAIECSGRYQDTVPSPYARFFDESSCMYKKNAEQNLAFLRMQQRFFNNRLYTRGFVMLNEIYEALDIPETSAGAVMGWIKNKPDEPTATIDFGIYNGYREGCRDFVNGYERSILLDFNVDPKPIWNRI